MTSPKVLGAGCSPINHSSRKVPHGLGSRLIWWRNFLSWDSQMTHVRIQLTKINQHIWSSFSKKGWCNVESPTILQFFGYSQNKQDILKIFIIGSVGWTVSYYSCILNIPPKVHVLQTQSPGWWCYWELLKLSIVGEYMVGRSKGKTSNGGSSLPASSLWVYVFRCVFIRVYGVHAHTCGRQRSVLDVEHFPLQLI